ncbi:MAG: dephospho-CoA kinase CoaE [Idiomarinaceae bacterium HL-53]|nr:MAG: dephospho-CoA kinase CoaE [Idiomarinaceae bacterium HL-53]CUS47381.1 dephospho-CoA kinase [Idiomarinaceae bacterium HL-53]
MKPIDLNEKFIVGLTGGIGSGKSAVTRRFEALGIQVVDADVAARDVVMPGSRALAAIVDAFGPTVVDQNGQLIRKALRALVFSDEEKKAILNKIMHPAIREHMLSQLLQADSDYVILSAPLLLENKLDTWVNRVLVIDVPPETQVSRTIHRDNVDRLQVLAIMQAQMNREERLEKADDVIDNSGPESALDKQVQVLHEKYLLLATERRTLS